LELLNKTRNLSGDIVLDNANENTNLLLMIESGARGNVLNLAQISASVGQQAMRGNRIRRISILFMC